MIDLNPIRNRIAWLEETIKSLVDSVESAPEGLSDATRQHLSKAIAHYALELNNTRGTLRACEDLNDRADTEHDDDIYLTDEDLY
jgi:hypothetical protein